MSCALSRILSCAIALVFPLLLSAQTGPTPVTTNTERVQLLYTGKLFGYFRVPDAEPPASGMPCPDGDQQRNSLAVEQFEGIVRGQKLNKFILVGMGDNFAPEVEARKFCVPPEHQYKPEHQDKIDRSPYDRSGKEFFVWDGHAWQTNEYVAKKNDAEAKNVETKLAAGQGFIPRDNVADFFVREGYAAVVPGKHDFYYGAERLRELALYLANAPITNPNTLHPDKGVQMLGANLVIETTWKKGHEPLSDKKAPPWFIPRFPTSSDLLGKTADQLSFSGLSEGSSVYPWFTGPHISLKAAASDLNNAIKHWSYTLCELNDGGDLDEPPTHCSPLVLAEDHSQPADDNVRYQILFGGQKAGPPLQPGTNYLFCAEGPVHDLKLTDKKGGHHFCMHFSVYEPLFQYPSKLPSACDPAVKTCERPKPFVLLETKTGLAEDVAIFGVIDPHLPDYVGLLNLSWNNTQDRFNTKAAVKEPAEALRELDEYFELDYFRTHGKRFKGIKVLLAQMSPEAAEILSSRLGTYQVVVSESDPERATFDHTSVLDWSSTGRAKKNQTRFVAVPEPFYDGARKKESTQWNVDLGSLTITSSSLAQGNWHLVSEHLEAAVHYQKPKLDKEYWSKVDDRLSKQCFHTTTANAPEEEQIAWLTLCAVQQATEADVAFLQKRDFFTPIGLEPHGNARATPRYEIQDLTDRIVWKGDFMIITYLPGSVLQKIMTQSKGFDSDDSSLLSLSDETGRGLLAVGIHYDSERSEYLVNGRPLDPAKLYSVVTSDFVTGGDTGYADLASAQAHAATSPADLDARLRKISSLVCRTLTKDPTVCLGPIDRNDYFDDFEGKPLVSKRTNTNLSTLKQWSLFFPPGPVPGDPADFKSVNQPSKKETADKSVQTRRLWEFSLNKLTFGVNALGHSGSDFDVQNNFSGVTSPGVTAVRTTAWATDFQSQYTRSWQKRQLQASPGYTYNTQYKGQPDDVRQVNQQLDLATFDLSGAYLWTGRAAEHIDSILGVHFETPLVRIFNAFQLGTTHIGDHGEPIKDQLRFSQDRSYTVLLRPGFRWIRRKSSLEFGPETGHEWNAIDGFNFITGTLVTQCAASAELTISQCVKSAVKSNPASITPASLAESLRSGHNHSGMYWKIALTVPFHPKVSYVFTDTGDWYFVHYGSDVSTDTRFRDFEQHQLKLDIFPNLSIGPEVDLLLYKNASTTLLPGRFLRQDTLMMKAQFSFDLFNSRKMGEQIKYAPPSTTK